jgi:CBS domain-containing protein
MLIEEVIEFLKNVPPFQFLDEPALNNISRNVSMEFCPKGTFILHQDGPPSEFLRIIKKGGVKVFIRPIESEEIIIDYRSEGDSFGLLSLVGGDKSRANVVAVDDTICYLIGRTTVLKLVDTNPSFTEYFLRSFLDKYIDKTYKEMQNKSLLFRSCGDKLLFTTPVGEVSTKKVITAPEHTSIREAAEIMSRHRNSSLVIVDENEVPTGIVTDRDFRDKVVSKGRDLSSKISSIMSVSLIKFDARDYCFEAILKMVRYNIHHLLVVDEGKLKGIVTNHDLMVLQGTSPISIAREIENEQTIEGLTALSVKTNMIIGLLLTEGARASNITRIITEINDRLLRKMLEITEKKIGRPPVNYCWIVFGSEGRKEQTFKTDQDNALIYADDGSKDEEEISSYFSLFAMQVRDNLLRCGFPLCRENFMASNPLWCQPLRVWKKYFSTWIYTPTPDAVLNSLILLDFRPVHGDFSLAESLRDSVNAMMEGQMIFLGYMANTIIKNIPPIGFFKSFVVEKEGEHRNELNLKIKGLAPFVDIARLFSLEKGVKETSTIDRIDLLKNKHTIVREYADEIKQAFEFIMLLRIQNQFKQIDAGREPDNFINPRGLSYIERRAIKDSFNLISKIQDIIIERYKPLIW